MIKNQRQYRITRAQATRFGRAIAEAKKRPDRSVPLILRKAQVAALRSQLKDLKAELLEYQALRTGRRVVPAPASLEELPQALIRARIASGMTQQGLARKLGLKAQQIQRYEATDYRSASLARLRQVARALGLGAVESAPPRRRPAVKASAARKITRTGAAD